MIVDPNIFCQKGIVGSPETAFVSFFCKQVIEFSNHCGFAR
ncbi:hypothetical protein D1AOALGA4SA_1280 [Olavius algarvensis Delta 1 endosymbiont]|nr:hypothetical protein D1AOALGA4SA_1280 [Olavius algarvensis Delta 1 endosymbiont]